MKADPPLLETRSSLINRLKATINGESWEVFFNTYWELIYNVARRKGLSEADSQDIVQETILKVHKRLARFQYHRARGSITGWLSTLPRSRLVEHYKKKQRQPPTQQPREDEDDPLVNLADPQGPELDRIWSEEWSRSLIQRSLTFLKQQVSLKQYQIFKCHCIDEWSVKEVCDALNVNAAQVYMAKQRVGKIFAAKLERLKQEEE